MLRNLVSDVCTRQFEAKIPARLPSAGLRPRGETHPRTHGGCARALNCLLSSSLSLSLSLFFLFCLRRAPRRADNSLFAPINRSAPLPLRRPPPRRLTPGVVGRSSRSFVARLAPSLCIMPLAHTQYTHTYTYTVCTVCCSSNTSGSRSISLRTVLRGLIRASGNSDE